MSGYGKIKYVYKYRREEKRSPFAYRLLCSFTAITFLLATILPPSYAQTVLNLPSPGSMVTTSAGFAPPIIRGLTLYPDNPLRFDFIVDTGDNNIQGKEFEAETTKLIKYFLASLTVPEDEFWVNLSPYEKDHIIPEGLGVTELGRDLLAQDYLLKQITASLMYPEEKLGSEFWKRVYAKAQQLYGTSEIPINTFNKVWIVPDRAVVYEHNGSAFVGERHLKVMLEEDYLALESNMESKEIGTDQMSQDKVKSVSSVTSAVVREILIPELEKEVNEGSHFANLRQIFNSMILATWYKKNLRESLLGQVYMDQNKVKGVDVEDKTVKQRIYDQYLEAFKKGVYNYIKEDYDPATQEIITRKYFSGGVAPGVVRVQSLETRQLDEESPDARARIVGPESKGRILQVLTDLVEGASNVEEAKAALARFEVNGEVDHVLTNLIMRKIIADGRAVDFARGKDAVQLNLENGQELVSETVAAGAKYQVLNSRVQRIFTSIESLKATVEANQIPTGMQDFLTQTYLEQNSLDFKTLARVFELVLGARLRIVKDAYFLNNELALMAHAGRGLDAQFGGPRIWMGGRALETLNDIDVIKLMIEEGLHLLRRNGTHGVDINHNQSFLQGIRSALNAQSQQNLGSNAQNAFDDVLEESPDAAVVNNRSSLPAKLGGSNFLEIPRISQVIERSYSEPERLDELAKIRDLNKRTDELRKWGQMTNFNGDVVYYPFGGVDPYTPFSLAKRATDVVSMGVEDFGTIDEIQKFFSMGSAFDRAGGGLTSFDFIRDLMMMMDDNGIKGIGPIALARIMSFMNGKILGIHFFNINDDGGIDFVNEGESHGKNAVIEFSAQNEQGQTVTKRFWYIRHNIYDGQVIKAHMESWKISPQELAVLQRNGYVDENGMIQSKILEGSEKFNSTLRVALRDPRSVYEKLRDAFVSYARYKKFSSRLNFQALLIKGANHMWSVQADDLKWGKNDATVQMITELTLDPAKRNNAVVLSDNKTNGDAPPQGYAPQDIWNQEPDTYLLKTGERFGYNSEGDYLYYGPASLLKISDNYATNFEESPDAAVSSDELSPEELREVNNLRASLMERVASLGLTQADVTQINRALDILFAKQLNQKRKTGTVYVLHPMEVALNLIQDLGKTDAHLIIAAILHDAVEDTDMTIENIQELFGSNVARIIKGVTNEEVDPTHFTGMSKQEKEIEKIRLYQKHVLDAVRDNEVFYIKILDLETNALALSNLNDQPQVQSRLANKYLRLVKEFAKKAKELGLTKKAAQYEAAIAEVEGYARNWEFSEALNAEESPDAAALGDSSEAKPDKVGGIDLNAAMLDLQIKRDGNGIPLPAFQQPIHNMKIDGFLPVIINVTPVTVPFLLGENTNQNTSQSESQL